MRYETGIDVTCEGFTWRVSRTGYGLVLKDWDYGFAEALSAGLAPGRRSQLAFEARPVSAAPDASRMTREEFGAWLDDTAPEYKPERIPALHREFAEVESTTEGAIGFVNARGTITRGFVPAFLSDFFTAQQTIREILKFAGRARVAGREVEEVFNRNRAHFALRVTVTREGRLVQKFVPESLFGWMLLQAVRELTGWTWRGCEVCSTSFEVNERDDRQARKRFCSPRCRQRNFRDQRKS